MTVVVIYVGISVIIKRTDKNYPTSVISIDQNYTLNKMTE